jgi:hypothetical protein
MEKRPRPKAEVQHKPMRKAHNQAYQGLVKWREKAKTNIQSSQLQGYTPWAKSRRIEENTT